MARVRAWGGVPPASTQPAPPLGDRGLAAALVCPLFEVWSMWRVAGILALALAAGAAAETVNTSSVADAAADSHSWGGVSHYYLYACNETFRHAALQQMQAANLKVLRIFVLEVQDYARQPCAGGGAATLPDVEPKQVGQYDDSILQALDQLLFEATQYGVKLTLALHDRWSLGCWRYDAYIAKYNLTVTHDCSRLANESTPWPFYRHQPARADFKARLSHILNYQSQRFSGGRRLGDLHEAIFSVEAENEAMGHMDLLSLRYDDPALTWMCEMSAHLRSLAHRSIAITSGGGGVGSPESDAGVGFPLARRLVACSALDVLCVHSYSSPSMVKLLTLAYLNLTRNSQHRQRAMLQEMGAQGATAAAKASKVGALTALGARPSGGGVPWMYWAMDRPAAPDSFNVWPGDGGPWAAIAKHATAAASTVSAQPWPELDKAASSRS